MVSLHHLQVRITLSVNILFVLQKKLQKVISFKPTYVSGANLTKNITIDALE